MYFAQQSKIASDSELQTRQPAAAQDQCNMAMLQDTRKFIG